jgi:acetoin utilization deacetylase AcuC-like enzyme
VLPELMERAAPQLVLYNAGVDVHSEDSLGLLKLTLEGIQERDRLVMAACAAAGVPVAAAIGGGYAPDHNKIVERHMGLHRAAREHASQLLQAVRGSRPATPRVQR